MQLKFYGGAQEVGRSAILLKDERTFIMDYGVKIDGKMEYPTAVPKVDAIILSHAHLDHSGFVPGLYLENSVPTFGTHPTVRISNLLLNDSLNIAKKEHLKARFHKRQVMEMVSRYTALDYHHVARFGNYDLEFYDAGHISGSAVTLIERASAKDYKRVVYTGDMKVGRQTLHRGAEVVDSDLLIIESTYATKDHPDRDKTIDAFIGKITETIDSGGTALIPAFAVGRSQEILAMLQQHGLAAATYIDGMAKEATSIVMNYPKYIDNYDDLAKGAREATWIRDRDERKDALAGGSIVLTTSGMLEGGPVLDYIMRLGKNSHIFITGFQQEGTNGRLLLDKGYIMLNEERRRVPTPVSTYDFSAHAGMSDLHDYVRRSNPQTVVCVHGSEENAKALAESLNLEGFEAYAPKVGDSISLGSD